MNQQAKSHAANSQIESDFGGPGGPWRARRTRFGHYCHWLLRLCWTHGYHTLWTNIGPLLYGMVCYLILLYGFTLNFTSLQCIA